ncbi:MAG: hypothetical protein R2734_17010 [Nocardioides sp.]
MQSSKTIVAVNKDAQAQFRDRRFRRRQNLHAVLPALVDEISRRRG